MPVASTPAIQYKQVNKWFGPLHVLRDVSLDVAPGEVVGEQIELHVTLCRCVACQIGASIVACGLRLHLLTVDAVSLLIDDVLELLVLVAHGTGHRHLQPGDGVGVLEFADGEHRLLVRLKRGGSVAVGDEARGAGA